jgi:hypothetical protein
VARAYHLSEGYNAKLREKEIDVFAWAAETGRGLVEIS